MIVSLAGCFGVADFLFCRTGDGETSASEVSDWPNGWPVRVSGSSDMFSSLPVGSGTRDAIANAVSLLGVETVEGGQDLVMEEVVLPVVCSR